MCKETKKDYAEPYIDVFMFCSKCDIIMTSSGGGVQDGDDPYDFDIY